TRSSDFPTHNPGGGVYFQGTLSGGEDAFISKFERSITGIKPIGRNIPDKFALYQNYPNPFNPVTSIRFDIPKESDVKITVYDTRGTEVSELVNQSLKAGTYEITFNASSLSSGIYFYTIETVEFKDTKKMMIVK
ncbi:MAG: T9SS type A sorting domain-containing protein, partial [Ignavibacteria bacterium]|nr:T9SS type A sorting domain-containing protein [Ignavibacteria bacterium]